MNRPRVVYWDNIPTPYTAGRWSAVAERGNLDFEVWFCAHTEPDRSWVFDEREWAFRYRYLPGSAVRLPAFGDQYVNWPAGLAVRPPHLLVSLYAGPAFVAGWAYARARGARTALRVLPTYDTWVTRHAAKERLKRYLFSHTDGFKTPGPEGAAYACRYGADRRRIYTVTQSIDVEHFAQGHAKWRSRRDDLRASLGLRGCVFIYMGRLWEGKGVSTLLDAFRRASAADGPPMSLLMVGDGRDLGRYRAYCAKHDLRDVVFAGFVQHCNLPSYYAAADVLVFPTLGDPNGLVVEEAMVSHLPVISTSAAGDIRLRVPEGEAGYVVPPTDAAAMADRMLLLARDAELRRRLADRAAVIAAGKNHDHYARDFERFVDGVLSSPPVGGWR